MEKLKELNELKHKLIDAAKAQMAMGVENVDTEEMGEVVDMIKDIAEAEEACMEACYYETVTEAMTDYDGKQGYDRWRYSSGRFAPAGRGHVSGYLPPMMTDTEMLTAEPMGYTDGRTRRTTNGTANGRMGNTGRMGYTGDAKADMESAIDTMGDIWADADPEMRKKMKTHVQDLLYQMEQN